MRTLWTFGCSFTAEYFPVGHKDMRSKYDEYKEWRNGLLPDVWPTLLAKKLDFTCQNMAIGGSSNYEILRQFIDISEKIKSGDILIFGWTSILRYNVVNFCDNNFNNILPNTKISTDCFGMTQQTLDEIMYNRSHKKWTTEIHGYIKLINLFIKNIGSHVFHWTADDTIFNNNSYFVNQKDFILPKPLHGTTIVFDLMGYLGRLCEIETNNGDLISRINDETNGKVDDCHFGEFGHKFQSEYFYNHIIKYIK